MASKETITVAGPGGEKMTVLVTWWERNKATLAPTGWVVCVSQSEWQVLEAEIMDVVNAKWPA